MYVVCAVDVSYVCTTKGSGLECQILGDVVFGTSVCRALVLCESTVEGRCTAAGSVWSANVYK